MGRAPPRCGTGRGLALTFAFGVPCSAIVDVRDSSTGIEIGRFRIAAEVDRMPDPVNVEAQMSGGALVGLGRALRAETAFAERASEKTRFHGYGGQRRSQVTSVGVRAPGTTGEIRGTGKPYLPVAAFAATRTRLREMPFARHVAFA